MLLARALLFTLTLGLLVGPLAVEAQQAAKVYRIGFLGPDSPAVRETFIDAFRQGLRDLGYVEGKNITIEYRWAEGRYERLPELAAELVRVKIDVIVAAGGTPSIVTYGIRRNFEVGIEIPFLFLTRRGEDDTEGLGDVSLRPEFVFVEEDRRVPSLAIAGVVKLPTASERKDLGSGRTDYTVELLASKSFGPTLSSVNVAYTVVGGDDDVFLPRLMQRTP